MALESTRGLAGRVASYRAAPSLGSTHRGI